MPLADVDTPGSPAYWMVYLAGQLHAKQKRLENLDAYHRGEPPLPYATQANRQSFHRLMRTARSNFAELIVGALCERMRVRSIRTAAAGDDNGDVVAWRIWVGNLLVIFAARVHTNLAKFGEAYTSVAAPRADEPDMPVICSEDPRQMMTEEDPTNPRRTLAAFKLYHDPINMRDVAILWLPGEKHVAVRSRRARPSEGPVPQRFTAASFDMLPVRTGEDGPDDLRSERYGVLRMPVRRFATLDGKGEFERQIDLLDRINDGVMSRLVIGAFQSFRQRAIEVDANAPGGGLPDVDEQGNKIDYTDVFAADPGALWRLPVGAKIWESAPGDMRSILDAVKDDIMQLATMTRTPFSMFIPDAANQSAEGAQNSKEGLVFKAKDRSAIAGAWWADTLATAFAFLGDEVRAQVGEIIIDWFPAERYSLAERAQADSQATSLPDEEKWRIIWDLTPDEVETAKVHRAAQALAAALAAPERNVAAPAA